MRFEPVHAYHAIGNRQRGVALIIVVVLLLIGLGAALFAFMRPASQAIERDKVTAAALAQAKAALIGYAASNPNQPGVLPCPDNDNDGTADSPCGAIGVTAVGRLPWKTLGLPDLRDGSGECLWYAVSANFKNSGMSGPSILNSDSAGTLVVNDIGGTPVYSGPNAVLAIVFAPGITLSTTVPPQNRSPSSTTTCGGNLTVANYLEGGNENGAATSIFVNGQATTTFNDQLLPITSDAVFQVVEYRVAREIRANLVAYFAANNYYPFASNYGDPTFGCVPGLRQGRLPKPGLPPGAQYDISTGCPGVADWPVAAQPPAWFIANNWHLLTFYTVASACANATPGCTGAGYLTVINTQAPINDKQALIIVAGRAMTGQVRPCVGVADCLEGENMNGDDIYIKNPVSPAFNDKLMIVAP